MNPKTAVEPPIDADKSVSSGRRLIHLVGDGHEVLHRIDFSAFIGVHRRLVAFSRMKRLLAILILAFCGAHAWAAQALPEMALEIKGHKVTAEVAVTDATRSTGLMHRRMLPENRGMLFVFAYAAPQSFWMMNTYVPLSIAFIDEAGTIINIADMKPLTTDPHPSAKPAKYALEMNQGWFTKRGIKAGAKIEGLKNAPQPH